MTQSVRERVTAAVDQEVEKHVPRLWRARARLYIPLVVDRICAIIDMISGEAATDD